MTEHTIPAAVQSPTLGGRINPLGIVVATILLATLLLVAGQVAIAAIHPAGTGSMGESTW